MGCKAFSPIASQIDFATRNSGIRHIRHHGAHIARAEAANDHGFVPTIFCRPPFFGRAGGEHLPGAVMTADEGYGLPRLRQIRGLSLLAWSVCEAASDTIQGAGPH